MGYSQVKALKKIYKTGLFTAVFFGLCDPSLAQVYEAGYQSPSPQNVRTYQANVPLLARVSIGSALQAGKINSLKFLNSHAMQNFYVQRHQEPYWVGSSGPYLRAKEMFYRVQDSWTHGLNPKNYHVDEIAERIESNDIRAQAELELLLTDSFMRYARDLSGKRIRGNAFKLNEADWRDPISAHEAINYLKNNENIRSIFTQIEPQGRTYKKLRKELMRLVEREDYYHERFLPIHFKGLMKPGWSHKEVAKLRGRLGVPATGRAQYVYDDHLAAAVMRFQKEHNLDADGVLGQNTLRVLNRTKKSKIKQLVANMERLRWVDMNRGSKYVMVNIPSYMLWAIEDNRVELEMPVIVGSPARRTRSFKTEISGVRFNPDWTIPPTVKRYDIWPKIKDDVDYLSNKGIGLYNGYGRNAITLDPASIDWQNLSLKELHAIRMVQIPGAHNPLGKTRILMENPYNMYLHDTNKRHYFKKSERALSSGCIRMSDPEAMAEFVMRSRRGWSSSDTERAYSTGEVTDVSIHQKIPVYILYYTNWINENGQVVFGNDIYGYDEKLIDLLADIDGYAIPRQNNNQGSAGAMQLVSYGN